MISHISQKAIAEQKNQLLPANLTFIRMKSPKMEQEIIQATRSQLIIIHIHLEDQSKPFLNHIRRQEGLQNHIAPWEQI